MQIKSWRYWLKAFLNLAQGVALGKYTQNKNRPARADYQFSKYFPGLANTLNCPFRTIFAPVNNPGALPRAKMNCTFSAKEKFQSLIGINQ